MSQDEVPTVATWVASHADSLDPYRREAVNSVLSRWSLNHTPMSRIIRALTREQSNHLNPLKELLQEYADMFELGNPERLEHFGVAGSLIPFDIEKCGHVQSNDRQCTRDAVPGTGLCARHGGQWMLDSDRDHLSQEIANRLLVLTERAVSTLADLMDNARSEKVRLDAATAILDRAGIGAVTKVEISTTSSAEQAASEIRERLLALSSTAESTEVSFLGFVNDDTNKDSHAYETARPLDVEHGTEGGSDATGAAGRDTEEY